MRLSVPLPPRSQGIKMNELALDPKVFSRKHHASYGVSYYLFHEPGDECGVRIPENPKNIPGVRHMYQQACFAQFLHTVSSSRRKKKGQQKRSTFNRIAYKPKIHTTKEEAVKWIKLAVKAQLLPSYVQSEHLDSHFVLKFGSTKDARVSPSLMYIYLTMLRHLEEYPDLVRIAVYLVTTHQMNIYAAILLGSKFGCGNSNHNFVDYSWAYQAGFGYTSSEMYGNDVQKVGASRIPLRLIIAMRRFVQDPHQYDDRICCRTTAWEVFHRINAAVVNLPIMIVQAKYLTNEHLVAAMEADTDAEIKQHFAAFEAESKGEPVTAVPAKPVRKRLPKRVITKRKA